MNVYIDIEKATADGKVTSRRHNNEIFVMRLSDDEVVEGVQVGRHAVVITSGQTNHEALLPYALRWQYREISLEIKKCLLGKYVYGEAVATVVALPQTILTIHPDKPIIQVFRLVVDSPKLDDCVQLAYLVKAQRIAPTPEVHFDIISD